MLLTNEQLKKKLTEEGISFGKKAKKAELVELLLNFEKKRDTEKRNTGSPTIIVIYLDKQNEKDDSMEELDKRLKKRSRLGQSGLENSAEGSNSSTPAKSTSQITEVVSDLRYIVFLTHSFSGNKPTFAIEQLSNLTIRNCVSKNSTLENYSKTVFKNLSKIVEVVFSGISFQP